MNWNPLVQQLRNKQYPDGRLVYPTLWDIQKAITEMGYQIGPGDLNRISVIFARPNCSVTPAEAEILNAYRRQTGNIPPC